MAGVVRSASDCPLARESVARVRVAHADATVVSTCQAWR
jgi:hypothetical protein